MKNVAVIAEYNPFHRGHQAQLERIEGLLPGAGRLVVMGGDFLQRGEPALVDKYRRAEMALAGGADLVLELPPAHATASAEGFARGAVGMIQAAGCAQVLAFGAEDPDLEKLSDLAQALESAQQDPCLPELMKAGYSYPGALAAAAERIFPGAADLLARPNNMLAVEYIKAIRWLDAPLEPLALPRHGADHNEAVLSTAQAPSGLALRRALQAGASPGELADYLPPESVKQLEYAIFPEDLSPLIAARLLEAEKVGEAAFQAGADHSRDLVNRLREQSPYLQDFPGLAEAVSTRSLTRARVRRYLLHLLLGISLEDQQAPPRSLKILGLKTASFLPGELKKQASLPLITKAADADPALLTPYALAHHLYTQLVYFKSGRRLPDEYHQSPRLV